MVKKMLLFIFDTMKLLLVNKVSSSSLIIDSDVFSDMYQHENEANTYDGFLGFYDWLINSRHQVVGVYIALSDFSESLITSAEKYPNIVVDDDRAGIYIFFTEERSYSEELSCSQSFGFNRAYTNQEGKLAISFDLPSVPLANVKGL